MSLIENVSRRQFLEGLFSTGAFVVAAQVLPEELPGRRIPAVRTRAQSAPLAPERLPGHRARRHGVHRDAPVRDGHGHPHVAAARRGRRARRRLEPRSHRAGSRRHEVRRPEHRRVAVDPRLLRRVPPRRRVRARDAGQRRRRAVGCARRRVRGAEPRGGARASGRRLAFGALVPAAAKLPVPAARDAALQAEEPSGSSSARNGRIYDLRRHHHAARRRSASTSTARTWCAPRSSTRRSSAASVRSVDDTEARKVRGVRDVITLDPPKPPLMFQPLGGVAVMADNTWAALKGRRALKVEWNDGAERHVRVAARSRSSWSQTVEAAGQGGPQPRQRGRRVRQGRQGARGHLLRRRCWRTRRWSRRPRWPTSRTARSTVWTPTQNPQAAQDTVAAALGIDKKDVTCHVTLLGGGFGRKSKPDFAAEAAVLSKRLGQPGEGGVDARGRPASTTSTTRRRPCITRPSWMAERQADGVAAPLGVPADRVHVRPRPRSIRSASSSIWA